MFTIELGENASIGLTRRRIGHQTRDSAALLHFSLRKKSVSIGRILCLASRRWELCLDSNSSPFRQINPKRKWRENKLSPVTKANQAFYFVLLELKSNLLYCLFWVQYFFPALVCLNFSKPEIQFTTRERHRKCCKSIFQSVILCGQRVKTTIARESLCVYPASSLSPRTKESGELSLVK